MTACKLIIQEHKSASYSPRTYHNAASADVTVALAVDHYTAGEKCTQKAVEKAGSVIVKLNPEVEMIHSARVLYGGLRQENALTINVAGNGMATWHKHGWTQQQVNTYVFEMFKLVPQYLRIEKIVSGGQTGTDLAGAVAAVKLGIDCVLTYPKGFKMRFEDGKDVEMTEQEVRDLIMKYVEEL